MEGLPAWATVVQQIGFAAAFALLMFGFVYGLVHRVMTEARAREERLMRFLHDATRAQTEIKDALAEMRGAFQGLVDAHCRMEERLEAHLRDGERHV